MQNFIKVTFLLFLFIFQSCFSNNDVKINQKITPNNERVLVVLDSCIPQFQSKHAHGSGLRTSIRKHRVENIFKNFDIYKIFIPALIKTVRESKVRFRFSFYPKQLLNYNKILSNPYSKSFKYFLEISIDYICLSDKPLTFLSKSTSWFLDYSMTVKIKTIPDRRVIWEAAKVKKQTLRIWSLGFKITKGSKFKKKIRRYLSDTLSDLLWYLR